MTDALEPEEAARREAFKDASFLIVARAENGVIGNQGTIPWRHSADMRHFRNATLGCALIVGRRTYDSLPKSMPGRDVIVVTSTPLDADAAAISAHSFEEAVRIAIEDTGCVAAAFAGGPRIYEAALALPWMTRAVVTTVACAPEGDASMPRLGDEWVAQVETPLTSRDGEPQASVTAYTRNPGITNIG
jgi:dihydrofolate reductase